LIGPERFRRGSSKKIEVEYEGHTLVFCTFKKPTFCDHCSKILTGKCPKRLLLNAETAANIFNCSLYADK